MSDRLRAAIARAIDEDSAAEHERQHERQQALCDQEAADERKRGERELIAMERAAMALQQIAEALQRISCTGLTVHGLRQS